MRTETKYNKIVNYDKDNKEVTVLDYTFKHSDDFKGATGTRFDIISKAEYKDRMKKENVIESLMLEKAGYEDIEYQQSDEAIKETIIANEYEFLSNGKLY